MELPAPGRRHDHGDPRRRGRHRHPAPGHRAPGRRAQARHRAAAPAAPEAPAAGAAGGNGAAAAAARTSSAKASPVAQRVAAIEGVDLSRVTGTGPGGRITKADVLAAKSAAAARTAPRPRRRPPARRAAAQGRRGDARQLHGREPVDPDRDLVPHADRHDDGRPPQGAQGGRPAGLLHPPHRLRDRPRGDRGDAGHGAPLRRDRRQAAPHRRRRRATSASPSTSRRRTARGPSWSRSSATRGA